MNMKREASEVIKIRDVIEYFRDLDPDISATTISAFLAIAEQEGMNMKELGETLGVAQSSCSRNVSALTRLKNPKENQEGLDLVVRTEDPLEGRRKIMFLSPKGKKMHQKIRRIIE